MRNNKQRIEDKMNKKTESTYNTDLDINNVVESALRKSIQAIQRDIERLGNHGIASQLKKQEIYEQRNLLLGLLSKKVNLKNHIETVDTENLMVTTQTSEFLPDFTKEEEKEDK
jgi:hypothetical protein|tara:strand:- start:69 stop:410 length:342 start_codon:yes stop_codon:yes gene_type:complete